MEKDNFRMGYLVLLSDTPSFRASPALFYQPLSSYGKILNSPFLEENFKSQCSLYLIILPDFPLNLVSCKQLIYRLLFQHHYNFSWAKY